MNAKDKKKIPENFITSGALSLLELGNFFVKANTVTSDLFLMTYLQIYLVNHFE